MMNYNFRFVQRLLLLGLVLRSSTVIGQSSQIQNQFAALDSFIVHFEEWGQFREKASNSASFDIGEKYKSLFMPDVWVYDNYNPKRDELDARKFAKPYMGAFKKIDEFVFDVLRYCSHGVNSWLTAINADYSGIEKGSVKFVIQRDAIIEDFNGKRLTSKEVFYIIVVDDGSGEWKIQEWKDLEQHSITCSNCEDTFEKTVNPADDPKARLKVWTQFDAGFGIGSVTLANASVSNLDKDIYLNMIEDRSGINQWNNRQVKSALQVGGLAEVMFGHRKQFGLAAGLYYSQTKLDLGITDFNLEYEFIQPESSYNRLVSGKNYREDVTISGFSLPVLGRFTLRINEKLKVHLALGGMLNAGTVLKSEISVSGTYNGIRYFRDGESFFNANPDVSNDTIYSWLVDDRGGSDELAINKAAGEDVGAGESAIGKEKFSIPLSFGVLARVGAGYMINSSSEIVVGLQAGMSVMEWESKNIQIIHSTSNRTNTGSLLSSLDKMQSTTFGLYAGLRVYLFSKKKN